MLTRLRKLLSILALLLLFPTLALAQATAPVAPKWSIGVTGGRVEDTGNGNLFAATRTTGSRSGMALDISGRTADRFGLVAELGLFDAASFMVGARWMPAFGPRARVFGQVLGGPVLLTLETTAFAVQAGAGVDFRLSSIAGFRLQADYRAMTHAGNRSHQLRALVGFVLNSRN